MLIKKRVVVLEFNKLPVIGDAIELIPYVANWLRVSWEGYAERIVSKKDATHDTAFDPVDKGGFGMFGLDKHGKIILGVVKYAGDGESKNTVEQSPHYFCKKTNCANPWG